MPRRRRPLDIEEYATQEEYLQELEEGGVELPVSTGEQPSPLHEGGPQYEAMLVRAMKWGAPREETHREIQQAYRAGQLRWHHNPGISKKSRPGGPKHCAAPEFSCRQGRAPLGKNVAPLCRFPRE